MYGIELSRNSEISLARQVFYQFKRIILAGQLTASEALPSTRALAKLLSVSRNTISEAYAMLLTEGFISIKQGAAPKVVADLALLKTNPPLAPVPIKKTKITSFKADFKTGQGDFRLFSIRLWQQMLVAGSKKLTKHQLGYLNPAGLSWLRQEIAHWLLRSKGVLVSADDVFLTTGTTHALSLITELLNKPNHRFIIEDPCHLALRALLATKGISYQGCEVDKEGIIASQITSQSISAIYVTPSHQFPLGGVLSARRRTELIQLARQRGCYVIEDDYDSEFRYQGTSISPLYSMDTERVIYIGTFSKILFPALRIGFVVLPKALQTAWLSLRQYTDVQNNSFEQAALAEFIASRRLDKHIQTMRKVYGVRRQLLTTQLQQLFGKQLTIWGDNAGLHLAIALAGRCFNDDLITTAKDQGIRLVPVTYYAINKAKHNDKLLLGYGHLNPTEMMEAIKLLYTFLNELSGSSEY